MFTKLFGNTGDQSAALIAALNKSPAVIEFKPDGTIITANANFLGALGYTLDEIKGKHHRMFVEPGHAQSADYRAFWEALARGEFQAAEYKRIGKGGKEVWIQASYNPILDPDGKPFKVAKYATDVTAQVLLRQKREEVGPRSMKNWPASSRMQAASTAVNEVNESLDQIASAVSAANAMAQEGMRLYRSISQEEAA